MFYILKACL